MVEPQLPQLTQLAYNVNDEADQTQMLLIIITVGYTALPLKTIPAITTAISVTLGCTLHKSRHTLSHYSCSGVL